MSESLSETKRFAKRISQIFGKESSILVFEVSGSALKGLKVKIFQIANKEWKVFITQTREGTLEYP